MFEDETVAIACPQCGHRNPVLVRQFEDRAEGHIVCGGCQAGIKIEAREFRQRLDQVREELQDIQLKAAREGKKENRRPAKDDYQI